MHELSVLSGNRGMRRLMHALDIGDELLWQPEHLSPADPWLDHVATAFWLVKAVQPELLVESGGSGLTAYGAFCQAIGMLGLPARAVAVGLHGSGADLREVHDRHYAGFSTLLDGDAAAARRLVGDGSVDLLHIGGARSYAAVRGEFDDWRGTLSERAVVVLHATSKRDDGCGVWRLWQELSGEYASFEFDHGLGLGLLGIGADQPTALQSLFDLRDNPMEAATVRRIFAARGGAFRAAAVLEAEQARIDALATEVATLRAAAADLTEAVAARDATIEEKTVEVRRRDNALRGREAALALQSQASRQLLTERDVEIGALRSALHAYRESTSWRMTAPLRGLVTWLQQWRGRAPARAPRPAAAPKGFKRSARPVAAGAGLDLKAAMRATLKARLAVFLASGATLRLPTHLGPDISIILVLHNQAELTYGCLTSIVECLNGTDLRVEVVILDNASTDATAELLARTAGATVINSPKNLHLLRGVNQVAGVASGRYLLLLNNDAQLFPGTVEAVLRRLDAEPDIGAVGGRIVLPDGTLQEAGSIVWRDGSCLGFARGRSPTDPEVMFRRDVDYCSGAFLLTRAEVFQRLAGFDERYAPAYYEETDYCLRLWQHGWRVAYEPDAVVMHYEFGSAAAPEAALEQQRRNHEIFRAQHQAWLAGQLENRPDNLLLARRRGRRAKRVLMIEDRVPQAKLGSGFPRAADMLRALAARAEVTMFPMLPFSGTWADVRASVDPGVEVMLDRSLPDLPAFLSQRRGFYDAIVVCRPHNIQQFIAIGGLDRGLIGDARVIYDAEAIFATREVLKRAAAGLPPAAAEAAALLEEELALARRAAAVISVSPAEKAVFEANGIAPVHLLGHSVAVDPTESGFAARRDILFVGALHEDDSPNTDSLRWFAESVLPLLRRELGAPIRLKVVGSNKVAAIAALDGTAFELIGAVDDLRPHFDAARVMVAPTRFAAGIPHKVAQAAAFGVPVVATELLARQIGWTPGRDLLAADDAEAFAAACARLYRDQALWEQVRAAALQRCREDCSPERFDEAVAEILATVPAHDAAAASPKP
jgi:GT2 family glycosyltransferase